MPAAGLQVSSTAAIVLGIKFQDGPTLSDLGPLIKALDKKAQTAVRKRLRAGIAKAGEDVTNAVKAEAAWSSRIPGSVRLATSFGARTAGVKITAGGKKAPHARALEFGNRNVPQPKRLSLKHQAPPGRLLRHPVFPSGSVLREDWVWVDMETRPFFFKATDAKTALVNARMQKVLGEIASDLGFVGK